MTTELSQDQTTRSIYFVLLGKAGAGKDYILNKILQFYPSINRVISATTRPPREGETNNLSYHFLTDEEGKQWIDEGRFLEHRTFRGWLYGTPLASINNGINAGISSPGGILNMKKYIDNAGIEDKLLIYPIYVTAPNDIRKERYLSRETSVTDDWNRRFFADEEDFKNIYKTLGDNFNNYMRVNNIKEIETWHNIKWLDAIIRNCQYPVIPPI